MSRGLKLEVNFGALAGYRQTLVRDLSDPVRVDGRFRPSSYACFDREKAIDAAVGAAKRLSGKLRADAIKIEVAIAKHLIEESE